MKSFATEAQRCCCQRYEKILVLHINCPILTKFRVSRQIFVKVLGSKLYENLSSGSRADTGGQTDRQQNRYDEASLRLLPLDESA